MWDKESAMNVHVPTQEKPLNAGMTAEANVYAGVYRALVTGMTISTILFAIGVVLAFVHTEPVDLAPNAMLKYYHWPVFSYGLMHGDPAAVMMLATIIMILPPIARVVVSIIAFAMDRDW
jgi:uncharacterized membrane protein